MSETIRTAPVTPAARRRAAKTAFFRNYGVIRITAGQQKAILDGRADGRANGRANGATEGRP